MKKVYLNEVETKSNELVNFSKKNINDVILELNKLPNQLTWEGLAKEKYFEKYHEKINKLNKLNENICKIAEFLVTVKDYYSNANSKIQNAYEELLKELKKIDNDVDLDNKNDNGVSPKITLEKEKENELS